MACFLKAAAIFLLKAHMDEIPGDSILTFSLVPDALWRISFLSLKVIQAVMFEGSQHCNWGDEEEPSLLKPLQIILYLPLKHLILAFLRKYRWQIGWTAAWQIISVTLTIHLMEAKTLRTFPGGQLTRLSPGRDKSTFIFQWLEEENRRRRLLSDAKGPWKYTN